MHSRLRCGLFPANLLMPACAPSPGVHFAGALEAKALQQFALSAFPSNVLRLTSATFQQALGMQPHRPKMVLVTDKAMTPPVFAALAANFVPRGMDFFDVHASEAEVLQQFGVAKPPALVLALLMPGAAGGEEGQHRVALQHYEGAAASVCLSPGVSGLLRRRESFGQILLLVMHQAWRPPSL